MGFTTTITGLVAAVHFTAGRDDSFGAGVKMYTGNVHTLVYTKYTAGLLSGVQILFNFFDVVLDK